MNTIIDLRKFNETQHREIVRSLSKGLLVGQDVVVVGNFASDQLKEVAYDLRQDSVTWNSKQIEDSVWEVNLHKGKPEELQGGCCGMCGGGGKK